MENYDPFIVVQSSPKFCVEGTFADFALSGSAAFGGRDVDGSANNEVQELYSSDVTSSPIKPVSEDPTPIPSMKDSDTIETCRGRKRDGS